MTMDQEEFPASEIEEVNAKKPYVSPELFVHGAVEKITEKTGPGPNTDNYNRNRS